MLFLECLFFSTNITAHSRQSSHAQDGCLRRPQPGPGMKVGLGTLIAFLTWARLFTRLLSHCLWMAMLPWMVFVDQLLPLFGQIVIEFIFSLISDAGEGLGLSLGTPDSWSQEDKMLSLVPASLWTLQKVPKLLTLGPSLRHCPCPLHSDDHKHPLPGVSQLPESPQSSPRHPHTTSLFLCALSQSKSC